MRCWRLRVAIILLMLLPGCLVYSKVPVGEGPASIQPKEWEGIWLGLPDFLPFVIKVKDPQQGILKVTWMERPFTGPKLESIELYLRSSGEWLLANWKEEDKNYYAWGRIQSKEKRLLLWLPRVEKFRDLVKSKKLPGQINGNDEVLLGDLSPEHYQMFVGEDKGALFQWDNPLVLVKVRD